MPLAQDCRDLLDQLKALGMRDFSELTPTQAREFSLAPPPQAPTSVGDVLDCIASGPDGDIAVRVYRPKGRLAGSGPSAVLIYFHGGGWVIGGLESHDETCRRLCAGSAVTVVAVDYRLAPEAPYPGAVRDCYQATAWVANNAEELDVDAGRLAVGGDSAGGNLAAATALMARDRGGPNIIFQLLVYPVIEADFERPSYRENAVGYLLSRRAMQWFWDHYAPRVEQRQEPYAAPIRGNLAGLPKALLQVAEFDPLRDEGVAYAQALQDAGVPADLTEYEGMIHGFFGMPQAIEAANHAMDEACRALRWNLAKRDAEGLPILDS